MMEKKSLGYVSLALLNISAIISLRHLPGVAQYGASSLIFYALAALTFLIPVALICAELATTWPERGGLYNWVYLSYGPRCAFLVVWWSWMAAVVTILLNVTFLSGMVAHVINPAYGSDPTLFFISSVSVVTGLTLVNIFGMRLSSIISSLGAIAGTIIPIGLITVLAFVWTMMGRAQTQIFSEINIFSLFKQETSLFFYSTVILGYAGIELAAFHASDAENPQRDYSKAILLSVFLIIALYVVCTLAIALVLPVNEIDLIGGVVQFFDKFFSSVGLNYVAKISSLILAIGTIGSINTWIISPAKGIFAATEHFHFPKWLTIKNKHDVPVPLLIIQAVLCSVILGLLVSAKSIKQSFCVLTAATTQFSLILYVFMALALLMLRKIQPQTYRPFRIPDRWVKFVAYLALISCLMVTAISFIPGAGGQGGAIADLFYHTIALVILSLPPFFFKEKK